VGRAIVGNKGNKRKRRGEKDDELRESLGLQQRER
jgi:hypothetical protein